MKRARSDDCVSSHSFEVLPAELHGRLLLPNIETPTLFVCKRWLHALKETLPCEWYDALMTMTAHLCQPGGYTPGRVATTDPENDHFRKLVRDQVDYAHAYFLRHGSVVALRALWRYVAQLPGPLAVRNAHKRDWRIVFFEEGHRYELLALRAIQQPGTTRWVQRYELLSNVKSAGPIDARPHLISVTALLGELFEEFDTEAVLKRMAANKRNWLDPKYKYYGMTIDQVRDQWAQGRDLASTLGTAMHLNLERYYNRQSHTTEGVEFGHFREFERLYVEGKLEPYRSEWLLYSEDLQLVGSGDMFYVYVEVLAPPCDGVKGKKRLRFFVGDWKRTKEIEFQSFLMRSGMRKMGIKPCSAEIEDCNYRTYSLQVMLYAYMLLSYYSCEQFDVEIGKLCIVVLHPETPHDRFLLVEYDAELVRRVIGYRRECVRVQRAAILASLTRNANSV